jgi:hypothetical protein
MKNHYARYKMVIAKAPVSGSDNADHNYSDTESIGDFIEKYESLTELKEVVNTGTTTEWDTASNQANELANVYSSMGNKKDVIGSKMVTKINDAIDIIISNTANQTNKLQ